MFVEQWMYRACRRLIFDLVQSGLDPSLPPKNKPILGNTTVKAEFTIHFRETFPWIDCSKMRWLMRSNKSPRNDEIRYAGETDLSV